MTVALAPARKTTQDRTGESSFKKKERCYHCLRNVYFNDEDDRWSRIEKHNRVCMTVTGFWPAVARLWLDFERSLRELWTDFKRCLREDS